MTVPSLIRSDSPRTWETTADVTTSTSIPPILFHTLIPASNVSRTEALAVASSATSSTAVISIPFGTNTVFPVPCVRREYIGCTIGVDNLTGSYPDSTDIGQQETVTADPTDSFDARQLVFMHLGSPTGNLYAASPSPPPSTSELTGLTIMQTRTLRRRNTGSTTPAASPATISPTTIPTTTTSVDISTIIPDDLPSAEAVVSSISSAEAAGYAFGKDLMAQNTTATAAEVMTTRPTLTTMPTTMITTLTSSRN
ncbi:hypothetical protein MMC09_005676 [Bachmanniomyces sp. S44760]|nr:hypothetical protein [Bachmanniomyces sp. S44760]